MDAEPIYNPNTEPEPMARAEEESFSPAMAEWYDDPNVQGVDLDAFRSPSVVDGMPAIEEHDIYEPAFGSVEEGSGGAPEGDVFQLTVCEDGTLYIYEVLFLSRTEV